MATPCDSTRGAESAEDMRLERAQFKVHARLHNAALLENVPLVRVQVRQVVQVQELDDTDE